MSNRKHFSRVLLKISAMLALSACLETQLFGQSGGKDRAEEEAEQMVSLSASSITQILLREPGLMLAVKKTLVRRAYEQGRLLDPVDLTDEALFQLLRDDANVRTLITREIADRSYVRATPSHGELQNGEWRIVTTRQVPSDGKSLSQPEAPARSQENQYWSSHEKLPGP